MESRQNPGLIIVRPGSEISLKRKQARQFFLDALERNLKDALERVGVEFELVSRFNAFYLNVSHMGRALSVLPRIFGIGSYSPVLASVPSDFDAVLEKGQEIFPEQVKEKTFAVRCKRIGGQSFSSMDVEKQLGAALVPYGKVNLSAPDVTCYVEAHNKTSHLFVDRIKGAGGMPGASQGHALALLSGGFDSAAAAWKIMKRGVAVDYVLCNLGGSAYERMVLQVAKVLCEAWHYGHRPRFFVVDFSAVLPDLKEKVQGSYRQVILKRLMYRAGEMVAKKIGAQGLITGEALAQVSSQTLENLNAISTATSMQVLRPLIGSDKEDIIADTRKIGTAVLHERVKEYCNISAGRPVIFGSVRRAEAEEARLDLKLLERAANEAKEIDLFSVTAKDLRSNYLFTDEMPEGSVVIDCQPTHMYRAWHVPEAKNIEAQKLIEKFSSLDKDKSYVLYCTYGTQTPYVAEIMQQAGYEAYAFRGGLSVVKKYVDQKKAAPQEA